MGAGPAGQAADSPPPPPTSLRGPGSRRGAGWTGGVGPSTGSLPVSPAPPPRVSRQQPGAPCRATGCTVTVALEPPPRPGAWMKSVALSSQGPRDRSAGQTPEGQAGCRARSPQTPCTVRPVLQAFLSYGLKAGGAGQCPLPSGPQRARWDRRGRLRNRPQPCAGRSGQGAHREGGSQQADPGPVTGAATTALFRVAGGEPRPAGC